MKIDQVMTRDVEAISPDSSIWAAAKRMRDLNVGFMPVVEQGQLIGVVTDRDITLRAVAEGLDPVMSTVAEVMTREVITCYADQEVEEAARVMNEHQIRRLLVLDRNQNLVGVISLGDLAVSALDESQAGETLQNISWPSEPER